MLRLQSLRATVRRRSAMRGRTLWARTASTIRVAPVRMVSQFGGARFDPMGERKTPSSGSLRASRGLSTVNTFPPNETIGSEVELSVNGAVRSDRHLFVNPAKENEAVLLPAIHKGKFVMLHGARGSGKTTRVMYMRQQLQQRGFCPLFVSLQLGVEWQSVPAFWSSFGRVLQRSNPHCPLPPLSGQSDFADLFSLPNQKSVFGGRRPILIIDEFDLLYSTPALDSVLNTLRGLKQEPDTNCLQSVVAVGPFSILKLTGQSASPFNVADAVPVPVWTVDHVRDLFGQYQKRYGIQLDDAITVDVHGRSAGHAGLTALCLKHMHERLGRGRRAVSFNDWLVYADITLPRTLTAWKTMQKMVDSLTGEIPSFNDERKADAAAARRLLSQRFLQSSEPITLGDRKEIRLAEYMTAEGSLVASEASEARRYQLASPLIRNLLLTDVISSDRDQRIPLDPPPLVDVAGGPARYDIPRLITAAIPFFDRAALVPPYRAFKQSRVPGVQSLKRDSNVPQEATYHFQLFDVLRRWLPNYATVIPIANIPLDSRLYSAASAGEKRAMKAQRSDLLIDIENRRQVIELAATLPQAELVDDYFVRVPRYAAALDAVDAWLVHFTRAEPTVTEPYQWPTTAQSANGLRVMHVWHDLHFRHIRIHTAPNQKPTELVLKD